MQASWWDLRHKFARLLDSSCMPGLHATSRSRCRRLGSAAAAAHPDASAPGACVVPALVCLLSAGLHGQKLVQTPASRSHLVAVLCTGQSLRLSVISISMLARVAGRCLVQQRGALPQHSQLRPQARRLAVRASQDECMRRCECYVGWRAVRDGHNVGDAPPLPAAAAAAATCRRRRLPPPPAACRL